MELVASADKQNINDLHGAYRVICLWLVLLS